MNEETGRARIVAEALSWLKTPYHHEGRVKGAGVDCGMLLLEVYEAAGLIPHVVPDPYPHDFHMHRGEEWYKRIVETYMHPCQNPPLPGDVVLYKFGRILSHGAIVIKWPVVVHSYIGLGVILDDAEANKALSSRQAGFWSFWGDR